MQPIRILQWGMTNNVGGVEVFIMNIYRNIDRDKVQFDFLLSHNQPTIPFEDEINQLGGRVFRVTYGQKESPIKARRCLDAFFKEHQDEFAGIHMHSCFITYALPLKYAKKYNIPIRIYHSHNAGDMYPSKSLLKKILSYTTRKDVKKWSTDLFACSDLAGKYMFHCNDAKWIKNAIDIDKFRFNIETRNLLREKYNLQDKKVVGFVGRLQYQKNPLQLIDIFNLVYQKEENSILIIIGTGDLENQIKEKIESYNLNHAVILLGQQNNVNEWYQAMDCFLFPSRFEGLGIVLIEAQCSGLSCVATNQVIPKEVSLLDSFSFLNIDESEMIWADTVIENLKKSDIEKRQVSYEIIKKSGYDITNLCIEMKDYYSRMYAINE